MAEANAKEGALASYMRKAYTYNIQLQRTQQTAHSACNVCHVVNISGTAESGYSCIETNTMSQARRPFTLENLSFHNKWHRKNEHSYLFPTLAHFHV